MEIVLLSIIIFVTLFYNIMIENEKAKEREENERKRKEESLERTKRKN